MTAIREINVLVRISREGKNNEDFLIQYLQKLLMMIAKSYYMH